MVVDPVGHEHAVGRSGENKRDKRQQERGRMDQPAGGQRHPEQQHQIAAAAARARPPPAPPAAPPTKGRSSRIRPASGRSTKRLQWMLDRHQPVLAKVEPVLAREQRPHLAHPHIVVGVAERERLQLPPAVVEEPGRQPQPGDQHQPPPMAVGEREDAIEVQLVLAYSHFSRSSRWASKGKRAQGLAAGPGA